MLRRGKRAGMRSAEHGKAEVNKYGFENRRKDRGNAEGQGHDSGAAGSGAWSLGSGSEQMGDGSIT